MDAPERIWLDWPAANRGEPVYDEPPERDTQPGQTEYVRADLLEAQAAQLQEAREIVQTFIAREVDYMTVNKLGDPEKQQMVQWGRAFLAKSQ